LLSLLSYVTSQATSCQQFFDKGTAYPELRNNLEF
jgi:hypothetical protein